MRLMKLIIFFKKSSIRSQRGDTIVEVMIVLVVLATVIALSYVTATRTLQDNQLTQERAYALKLSEAQLEKLKVAVKSNPSILSASPYGFCLNDANPPVAVAGTCQRSINATSPSDCSTFCFNTSVTRISFSGDDAHSFRVTTNWNGPRGTDQAVTLVYKVYD